MANPVDIEWNSYADASIELVLRDEMIAAVAARFPTDAIRYSLPLHGGVEIVRDPRQKVAQLLQSLQRPAFQPTLHVRYVCDGAWPEDDLDFVGIAHVTTWMERNHVNFELFGMGISLTFRALVSRGIARIDGDECSGGQQRKIQEFLIDWLVDYSITPGVGGSVRVHGETQAVRSPCCDA